MTTNIKPILRATHKDFHPLLRKINEMDGEIVETKGGHIQIRLGKYLTHIAKTPRDPRPDMGNMKRLIRAFEAEITTLDKPDEN
jgi:hypothetical protein